jgi:hypothetical protein
MAGAIAMAGLFVVVTVQLVFAELHGPENFHHHRSALVDGPVVTTDGSTSSTPATANPEPIERKNERLALAKAEEEGAFLKVVLLEMGILFHSVFIGQSLISFSHVCPFPRRAWPF